jgi:hypothetical protein
MRERRAVRVYFTVRLRTNGYLALSVIEYYVVHWEKLYCTTVHIDYLLIDSVCKCYIIELVYCLYWLENTAACILQHACILGCGPTVPCVRDVQCMLV